MSVGGHLVRNMLGVVVVGRMRFCAVGVRSAMLRNQSALWSDPRSIALVDSQSFTVFQKCRFVKM